LFFVFERDRKAIRGEGGKRMKVRKRKWKEGIGDMKEIISV
jgi:hypothetical protein